MAGPLSSPVTVLAYGSLVDETSYTFDFSRLTPRQRLVVTLHYFCGWTMPEIALALRISVEGVRNTNTRALHALNAHPGTLTRGGLRSHYFRGQITQ